MLAKTFAGTDFGQADVRAWTEQMPARPDRKSRHFDAMSELHTILTAEQRTALAAKVTVGEVFAGRKKGHRKHERSEGDEHKGRRIEHFREPLDCSDAQKAELTEFAAKKHEAHPNTQVRKKTRLQRRSGATYSTPMHCASRANTSPRPRAQRCSKSTEC